MLRELGFTVREAIRLYTVYGARRPLPLIRVTVPKGEDVDWLLRLTSLFDVRVRVERSREVFRSGTAPASTTT